MGIRRMGLLLLLAPLALPLRAQIPAAVDTAAVLHLIGGHRLTEAESLRQIIARLGSDTTTVDLALGRAFLDAQDFARSLPFLESAWPRGRSRGLAESLAYAAFMGEAFEKAKLYAKRLLDDYGDEATACELLGSIYLIQDDLGPCLAYWNRIGKPVLYDIRFAPPAWAETLKHALPVYKGRIFRVRELAELEDLLGRLAFIRHHSLLLMPREDGLYDLDIRIDPKPPLFDSPADFLVTEAFQILQSQFRLEWNRVGGTPNSLGLLYRYREYRKAVSLSLVHTLAFRSDVDLHLAYRTRDETWFPESAEAVSFHQGSLGIEAVGSFLGGTNDRWGFFTKSYSEPSAPARRYIGGSAGKRFHLLGASRSTASADFDAGAQWEIGEVEPGKKRAFGGVFLSLSAQAGILGGGWRSAVHYVNTRFPDRSDYQVLGLGPGLRYAMRAHTYQLDRVDTAGNSLFSKHFLLGNSQLEIDLTPRSLIDLKAVAFWDCLYRFDRVPGFSPAFVNDIGLGLDIGFLSRKIASVYAGYNLESRSFSIYLGPRWDWD